MYGLPRISVVATNKKGAAQAAPGVEQTWQLDQADRFMWARRIGRNTNHASSAASAFMTLATMNTACQPPVAVASTLDSGTSSEAVPLAV